MQFARVVEVYDKIAATTKRLEMTDHLVRLLRDTPSEDLDKVVYLTQGHIHPDYMGIELGLAEKMVLRVVTHATGLDESKVNRMWKDKGDLGLVAEDAISARRQKPLESTPLTVAKVYENLDAIASESGEGSQERKVRLLSDLLGNATPREAKYIVRMVVGKMRLGIADMTIVDALALTFATKADRDRVEQAYNVSSDLGEVARAISTKGLKGLDEIRLKLFLPFQEVSRRRGRKTDVDRMAKEFPVTLFSFDCLLRDGEDLTPRPYTERRKALEAVVGAGETIRYSTSRVTESVKEAEKFFDE